MLTQLKAGSKQGAITTVRSLGFTDHYDTGESGDEGYGSRLYFRRPNAPTNEYGAPLQHATVSLVSGSWHVSIFE